MKRYLLLMCVSCGGVPFTEAPTVESVIMTNDASPESAPIGSEADVRQSEPSVQLDSAVLPMGVDSGDAFAPMVDASMPHGDSDAHNETSIIVDASPDSSSACVASMCICPSGYVPCCKSMTACGCVSAVFPQGCY